MTVKALMPVRKVNLVAPLTAALQRIADVPPEQVHQSANSYFGLLRQASHSHTDRAELANAMRRRGHCVDRALTKTFARRST